MGNSSPWAVGEIEKAQTKSHNFWNSCSLSTVHCANSASTQTSGSTKNFRGTKTEELLRIIGFPEIISIEEIESRNIPAVSSLSSSTDSLFLPVFTLVYVTLVWIACVFYAYKRCSDDLWSTGKLFCSLFICRFVLLLLPQCLQLCIPSPSLVVLLNNRCQIVNWQSGPPKFLWK